MDELIRELEERSASLRADATACNPENLTAWIALDAAASSYHNAAVLAVEAKRRMADREPAWELDR
jgi:hypothetical protein